MAKRKGILERLAEGPVVGDGSMCRTLEKRGYCTMGPYTPEAVVEFPEAVLQLHREFVRAGADVVQTATFFANEERLKHSSDVGEVSHTVSSINEAACKLARQAADEGGCLVCGSISPLNLPGGSKDKDAVRKGFEQQAKMFEIQDIDFYLAEFFDDLVEIEICAEVFKKSSKPLALSMAIGPAGDASGTSVEDCAVRMAKTGAEIIGTNCRFDFNTHLKVLKRMKIALDKEGFQPYLLCQPFCALCPEVEDCRLGNLALPEHPMLMEPRELTRVEVHKFARAAWELGIRYIGGCCSFESYHIRAIAQELATERGRVPPCHRKCPPFAEGYLFKSSSGIARSPRSTREYWYNVKPGFGRPSDTAWTKPQNIT